ncbi:hypothetical protein J3459_013054 [Metarhizium acridum]|nr:hypothetical protein J3459_013054 [Metarhizium acridum]
MSTSIRDGGIGAAVGVIIGILLGAASVWFYFVKQRQAQIVPLEVTTFRERIEQELKIQAEPPRKMKQVMSGLELSCKEDGSLRLALGMACVPFANNAPTFYHTEKLSEVPDAFEESLRRLCLDEVLTETLKDLLLDPKTRLFAIVHLQVRVVFSNLDIHTIGPLSLLPSFVTGFIQSLPLSTKSYTGQSKKHGLCPLTLWRKLTVYSMTTDKIIGPGPAIKPAKNLEPQIKRVVNALADVLEVFAKEHDGKGPTHREEIDLAVRDALGVGYEIFSHRFEWQYSWDPEPTRDGITITPGLLQLCDQDGMSLWEPELMEGLPDLRIPGKHPL